MRYPETCISCGSTRLARYRARAEPFLLDRIPALRGAAVRLVRCRDCDLAFFEPRLEGPELAALYDGYRSPEYQRARQRHEPGYTPEVNASVGVGPQEIAARIANMSALLGSHLALSKIRSVLDYGGDRGQYIPRELASARRVVYEISGTEPLEGIRGVRDWALVRADTYDLLLCNHVLEHVTFPRETIADLASVAHDDSWLYFEVPHESPFDVSDPRLSARFKRLVLEVPALANLKRRGVRGMHEHVTLFSPRTLARALEAAGLAVVETRLAELEVESGRVKVVSSLARKRAARA